MIRECADSQIAFVWTRGSETVTAYSLCPSMSLIRREKGVLWPCCHVLSMQGLP